MYSHSNIAGFFSEEKGQSSGYCKKVGIGIGIYWVPARYWILTSVMIDENASALFRSFHRRQLLVRCAVPCCVVSLLLFGVLSFVDS